MQRWERLVLAIFLLIGSACSAQTKPDSDIAPVAALWVLPTRIATATATATSVPATPIPAPPLIALLTATPSPELTPTDTPTPEPTPTPTPENWLESVGRTADNLMFMGNPAAPVTMIDYSDFL